jgi:hypothetical protein
MSSINKTQTREPQPAPHVAVVYKPLDELKVDPRNPRAHSVHQVRQIARSIQTFGFNVPVLIDSDQNVIAGHGRIQACRQLGHAEVPTIRLDHLTRVQARAFMLADNKLTDNSVWDDRLLAEHLRDLSSFDLDFSLEVTGFEIGEIDLRIEGLGVDAQEQAGLEDDASEPPIGPSVTQPGDLWLLGDDHRVLCASALDEGAYPVVMQGERAGAVFIDPPYNVPIEDNVSGLGAVRHPNFAMASGEMSPEQFTAFLTTAFKLHAQHSDDGALHFAAAGGTEHLDRDQRKWLPQACHQAPSVRQTVGERSSEREGT